MVLTKVKYVRLVAVVMIFVLSIITSASANPRTVQVITIVNRTGVSASELIGIERAIVVQSYQLRDWWHTPIVRFAPGGWRLLLDAKQDATDRAMPGHAGYGWHTDLYTATGQTPVLEVVAHDPPWAWNAYDQYGNPMPDPWSVQFSHEVLETLVNPYGANREVCDPVVDATYRTRGVWVSDFVTPRWFWRGHAGPWDQMRRLVHAGETW